MQVRETTHCMNRTTVKGTPLYTHIMHVQKKTSQKHVKEFCSLPIWTLSVLNLLWYECQNPRPQTCPVICSHLSEHTLILTLHVWRSKVLARKTCPGIHLSNAYLNIPHSPLTLCECRKPSPENCPGSQQLPAWTHSASWGSSPSSTESPGSLPTAPVCKDSKHSYRKSFGIKAYLTVN